MGGGIEQKIEDIEDSYVGVNLLVGANQYTENNKLSVTGNKTSTYGVYKKLGTVSLEKGKTYAVSYKTDGKKIANSIYDEDAVAVFAYLNDAGDSGELLRPNISWGVNKTGIYHLYFYVLHTESTYSAWNAKVDLGTRATKYVPNIEEIQSKIDVPSSFGPLISYIPVGASTRKIQFNRASIHAIMIFKESSHLTSPIYSLIMNGEYIAAERISGSTNVTFTSEWLSTGKPIVSIQTDTGRSYDILIIGAGAKDVT